MPKYDPMADAEILRRNGFDPTKVYIDDEGAIRDIQQGPTISSAQETIRAPQSSATGAFFKNLGYYIPEAAGGLGGAALGATVAAPIFPPVGSIGGALIGGFGGSIGTGAVKEKLVRKYAPQIAESVEQSAAEHPYAATAGRISSSLIGLKPSPSHLRAGLSTLRNITTRGMPISAVSANELANLTNIGVGGALGAGSEIASDIQSDQPVSLPRAALAGVLGAAINEPHRLGTALSFGKFRPTPLPEQLPSAAQLRAGGPRVVSEAAPAAPTKLPLSQDVELAMRKTGLWDMYSGLDPDSQTTFLSSLRKYTTADEGSVAKTKAKLGKELNDLRTSKDLVVDPTEAEKTNVRISEIENELRLINRARKLSQELAIIRAPDTTTADEIARMEAEGGTGITVPYRKPASYPEGWRAVEPADVTADVRQAEFPAARAEDALSKFPVPEPARQPATPVPQPQPQRTLTPENIKAQVALSKPGAAEELTNALQSGTIRTTERRPPINRRALPQAEPGITEAEAIQARLEREQPLVQSSKFESTELGPVTKNWDDFMVRFGLKRRATDVKTKPEVISSITKEPIAGRALGRESVAAKALAEISAKSGWNTYPHELIHILIDDTLRYGSTSERNLINRMLREYGWDGTSDPIKFEEALVQRAGEDFVDMVLGPKNDTLAKDIGSWLRSLVGQKKERYARRLANWLRYGKPFSETVQQRISGGTITQPRIEREAEIKNIGEAQNALQELRTGGVPETQQAEAVSGMAEEVRSTKGRAEEGAETKAQMKGGDVNAEMQRQKEAIAAMRKTVEETPEATPQPQTRTKLGATTDDMRGTSSQHINYREQRFGPQAGEAPERTRNIFAGETEVLRSSGIPIKTYLADSFERLHANYRSLVGRYMNPMLKAIQRLTPEQQENVYGVLIDEDRTKANLSNRLTSLEEQVAHSELRDIYRQMALDQIAANQPLSTGRRRGVDPYGWFNVVSRDVFRILREQQGTQAFTDLKNEFIAWQVNQGKRPAEAEKAFGKFVGYLTTGRELAGEFQFGSVRTPEGYGLPDKWIEPDFTSAIRRYTRSFARDRAFWDTIETDPKAMAALGQDKYGGRNTYRTPVQQVTKQLVQQEGGVVIGDPTVRKILASYAGEDQPNLEPILPSVGRVINAAILGGPITKLTDLFTTPFKALTYLRPQDVPGLLASMTHWRQGIDNAFETGFNKRGGTVVAQEILGIGEQTANRLNDIAQAITKYSGSEALELAARGLAQTMGEFIGVTNRGLALSGDQRALRFLNKLGSDWQSITDKELGTRIGQLMQGRYDITNLPEWMRNSYAAPFLTMMRWSVEQFNNFKKFVYEPALKNGDMMPLLMTLVGGVGGGLAVNELREKISGRKQFTATWEELNQARGSEQYAKELIYKLMAAAQVTGTAGIFSEVMKQIYEKATGKLPQGFRYPVWEVASDVQARISSAVNAIADGEPYDRVVPQLLADVMSSHVQMARILHNQIGNIAPEFEAGPIAPGQKIEQGNRSRDLRVFNALQGEPVATSPRTFPEYRTLTERLFERAKTPQEAAQFVPELMQRAVNRSEGNPERLVSELRKLRTAPNMGIPSLESNPIKFMRYIQYIQATQGPDAAQALLREYAQQRLMKSARGSMIPSISLR